MYSRLNYTDVLFVLFNIITCPSVPFIFGGPVAPVALCIPCAPVAPCIPFAPVAPLVSSTA